MKLTQQAPKPGQPTPYETQVQVIVTNDRIYFGFTCKDPDPRHIAIHTMRRDGDLTGDDTVSIVLDTYGDRRTGYFFQINAAGTRVDGLISTADSVSLDWDGIWDARTARTPDGWSAEIVIPSRTLSFTPGLNNWGLNLERFVPRERLWLRWSSPTLDSFLYDLSRAGRLSGVGEVQQGKGLEITPYAVGKTKQFYGAGSSRSWQGAVGGEVTWKITPQLVTVFTANTDFAETEVDTRQINLTRFPLFFPEKRSFFLEGANQYDFGLGLARQDSPLFIPFFSRNVGLLDGAQIPIRCRCQTQRSRRKMESRHTGCADARNDRVRPGRTGSWLTLYRRAWHESVRRSHLLRLQRKPPGRDNLDSRRSRSASQQYAGGHRRCLAHLKVPWQ